MRHGKSISRLILAMAGVCLVYGGREAAAQDDNSLFVGKPVPVATVRHVEKKGRAVKKIRPRQKIARVPLLAVQLRLLKLREDGSHVETNPQSQFFANDRLRLGVTANQSGYLTIIRQPGPDRDGEILFPTSLLNEGTNYVAANKEFVVPSNCPAGIKAWDCAYRIPESAGAELFTVIFSRDLITDLPEEATTPTGSIKAQFIKEIEGGSVKQLEVKPGASRFSILVVNMNRRDNEEIFTRFGIMSRGPSPLQKTQE